MKKLIMIWSLCMFALSTSMMLSSCEDKEQATIAVTSITLNKQTLSLVVGTSETLTATIVPGDATNKNVTWSSNKTDVAAIDGNGRVTALKAGTATITVTTADGGKTATCTVTVTTTKVDITGVTLNKQILSLNVGNSETLTATIAPGDATNKNVTWRSDRTTVATVDGNGRITAVGTGTANITVTTVDGSKTATCAVTVTTATVSVTEVRLNKQTLSLVVGIGETLTATIVPGNATNKSVTWNSNKTDVASVDGNGRVTALKAGTANITATTADGGKTATCIVTVNSVYKPVSGVTLNRNMVTLKIGNTETLTATVLPADATDKTVAWSSTDPLVATVNNNGTVTALHDGTAFIIATVGNGAFRDICNVTVEKDPSPGDVYNLNPTKMLNLVNQVRATGCKCGTTNMPPVPALKWNNLLAQAAYLHSVDMDTNDYFSHTSLDGRTARDRIRAIGYNWANYGETIARGYGDEEGVMNAWFTSTEHCKILMGNDFTEVGAGREGYFWTLDIARPK